MDESTGPAAGERLGRRGRAAVAGHAGDETTARELLDDGDAQVRATAIGALARMGSLDDGAVRAGLADSDPIVRRRALSLAIDRTDIPIVALLEDADASVAEQAAWACGERQPPEPGAVSALAAAAGHEDPLVRESAVAALGALGDPAGLPAILTATADKPAVRRRAVLALAPFDGPAVQAALQHALKDRDWQVRQAAEDLLSPSD